MPKTTKNPTKLQTELAARIIGYVQRQSLQVNDQITEVGLANEFKVSRTPIHGAVQFLCNQGVLEQRPKNGYILKKAGNDLDKIFLKIPETEEDQLYMRIALDRGNNRLPNQISEADLMRHYKASRGLVTRVLRNMSDQGLVSRGMGMKWSFSPVLNSREAHDESYEFRLMVEPPSILISTFQLDVEWAERCRQTQESILTNPQISSVEWFNANADFHEMIATSSGNRFILEAVRQQNRVRRVVDYHWIYSRERAQAICDEHISILDALEQGNHAKASSLLRHHLQRARNEKPNQTTRPLSPYKPSGT